MNNTFEKHNKNPKCLDPQAYELMVKMMYMYKNLLTDMPDGIAKGVCFERFNSIFVRPTTRRGEYN